MYNRHRFVIARNAALIIGSISGSIVPALARQVPAPDKGKQTDPAKPPTGSQTGAKPSTTPATTPPKPAPPTIAQTPPTAIELDRRGKALLDQGKVEEAIATLNQAVTLDPKDVQGYIYLGLANSQGKHYDKAAGAFGSAVELSPNEAMFHAYLGDALAQEGQYAAAQTAYSRAVELDPNDIQFRLEIGNAYVQEKDYDSARDAFLKSLGYAPDDPRVHAALGDIDEQLNEHGDALAEYDAALRIDPKNESAILGRSTALAGLKRFDESEKLMRSLVAAAPKDPEAHSGLAQALDAAGKHDAAIAEYNIASQLAPDNAYFWGNKGWSQYEAGRMDESIASGRKAIEMDPKLSYVWFNIGLAYAVRDRWQEAQAAYESGVKVGAAADIRSGITDLKTAQAKTPGIDAVRRSLEFMGVSLNRSLGLPDDLLPSPTTTTPPVRAKH